MSYTETKRDSQGRLIYTPMQRDSQGNYRPLHPVQQTACRLCGRPNSLPNSSTCSRCDRG